MKRIIEKKQFIDDNGALFGTLKAEKPEIYDCAVQISDRVVERLHAEITQDEILYLMIHINRIIKNNTIN